MKKILLLLICCASCLFVHGQNQANWWFFGAFAGIDFNNGTPQATSIGQLDTVEGCASIADFCGALLFYTDGITVWDSTHQIMLNGDGLLGDPSSTQSAIIIPQPSNNNRYFIFTVGDVFPRTGLNYSVVDMTLNGGLGAIVPNEKNINVLADSTEKITAAVNATGDSAWILTYAEQTAGSGNFNTFFAFKLTASGLDLAATVQSTFNNVQTTDRRGYLKVSPDGTALAMMTQQFVNTTNVNETGRGAWFFSFNNATGRVFNALRLPFPAGLNAYGTEFSPDSSKIYVDLNTMQNGINGDRVLYQYDRNVPNFQNQPATIYATDANDASDNVARGGLQLGPDGLIYYTRKGTEWLATITNPNAAGAAANFVLDGIRVSSGSLVQEGLPPFYNAFLNPTFNFTEGCVGATSLFNAAGVATCPGSTVLWDFGDPASGVLNNATATTAAHVYNTTGTFTVTLRITTIRGVFTSSKDIVIENSPVANPVAPVVVCDDDTNDGIERIDANPILATALGLQNPAEIQASIHSSLQDATADFNALERLFNATTGTYYVRLDTSNANGCYEIIPFEVIVAYSPQAHAVDDINACDDFTNDGVVNFDLAIAGSMALGSQSSQVVAVSYHRSQADATNYENPLPETYNNTALNETIFIRLQNRQYPECFTTTITTLNVYYQPLIPVLDDLTACDDSARDGTELFDLAALLPTITNTQPANLRTSFHLRQQEALDQENELPLIYQNTSATQTIWVRLQNTLSTDCVDVQPLQLVVYPKPTVTLPQNILKCANQQISLQATPGFESYLWNTGDTRATITVTDEGTYTVNITDENGCTDSATTTVTNYEPTRIVAIDIVQFTIRSNRIAVTATGSGLLTYSIDNVFYQESPVFENLIPGFYTVYVRDGNGCDLITQRVNLIAAPNFFTPNNDGFHDTWQVIAIDKEPDAQIYIFDRFGKLLKQLDPLSTGWDGTYLGNPMPSSDYWFSVRLSDGQSFKGHFTLKR